MKTRIIGSIVIIIVLAALYFVSEGLPQGSSAPAQTSAPSNNDSSFKSLSIN